MAPRINKEEALLLHEWANRMTKDAGTNVHTISAEEFIRLMDNIENISAATEKYVVKEVKWKDDELLDELDLDELDRLADGDKKSKEPANERVALQEILVKEFNEAVNKNAIDEFMLAGPINLTVKMNDGGFSKKNHIGGEGFIPIGAYLGKRGQIIYQFKPVDIAPYKTAELTERQVTEYLSGFDDFVAQLAPEWCRKSEEALKKKRQEKRAAEEQRHRKSYGEDYGSW